MTAAPETDAVVSELEGLPIGDELGRDRLAALAPIAVVETIATGTIVQRPGEAARDLRILLTGRIALSLPHPGHPDAQVGTLSRGDLLGWSALLPGSTADTAARAVKVTQCVRLPADALARLCEHDHELGYHLVRHALSHAVRRLHDAHVRLLDVFGRPSPAGL